MTKLNIPESSLYMSPLRAIVLSQQNCIITVIWSIIVLFAPLLNTRRCIVCVYWPVPKNKLSSDHFAKFHSMISEKKSKIYQPIRGPGAILFFQSNEKKVKIVEILLPVNFLWIHCSSCRGGVENASANRGCGGHLVFSARKSQT